MAESRNYCSHVFALYEARREEVRSAFVVRLQESIRGGQFVLTSTRSLVVNLPVTIQEVAFLRDGSWRNGPKLIEDGKVTYSLPNVPPEVMETLNLKLRPCFDALIAACTEKARVGDCTFQRDDRSEFLGSSRLVFTLTHAEARSIMERAKLRWGADDVVALGVACSHTYEADVSRVPEAPGSPKAALVTLIG